MATHKLGPRGETLIKSYERLRLQAYKAAPHETVWTIGWGHTRGVRQGDVITEEQAHLHFLDDVLPLEAALMLVRAPLTPSMTDALISLMFNCGKGAIARGTTIAHALDDRDYFAAWRAFALWTRGGGQHMLGLARRRATEMTLFFEDGLP